MKCLFVKGLRVFLMIAFIALFRVFLLVFVVLCHFVCTFDDEKYASIACVIKVC